MGDREREEYWRVEGERNKYLKGGWIFLLGNI
jgi:hypothetical protein